MGGEISSEESTNPQDVLKVLKICKGFFQNPTEHQLEQITKLNLPDTAFRVFVCASRSKWNLGEPLTKSETLFLDLNEKLLLNPNRKLTVQDLDCLWCLYHATGDHKYTDRIRNVFQGKENSDPVVAVASRSYQKYLDPQ